MNLNYEKIYNAKQNNPNFESDIFGIFAKYKLEHKFLPPFHAEVEREYFKQFPRRKKFGLDKAIKDLPDNTINEIRDKWQNIALKYLEHKIKQYSLLSELLDNVAPSVEITPTKYKHVLKSCHVSNYRSQGWGAHKYTKNSVSEDLPLVKDYRGKVVCFKNTYYLVANLEKWQFDVLKRKDNITILQWAVNCWSNGVNPRVYNPFLSMEIVDKSMNIYMSRYKAKS